MERRRLGRERLTLLLGVGDLLAALVAYAGAFALRIWVPIPFTSSLLPPDRAELLHPRAAARARDAGPAASTCPACTTAAASSAGSAWRSTRARR